MSRLSDMPAGFWKLALTVTALIWGGSFVVIKDALGSMPASWLMGIRFACAALVMGVFFHRRLARNLDGTHLLAGAILGVVAGLGYVVQNVGLSYTTPGRNAFLTAAYCIMVPFVNWVFSRRKPGGNTYVAAALYLVGVGMLSLGDDLSLSLGRGDWLTLASALFFAIHIVLVGRFAPAHDMTVLTFVQIAFSSATALACAALTEPIPSPSVFTPRFFGSLAYLVLLSTCLAFLIQNEGQNKVPPSQAALLLSLETPFAVVASVAFMGEQVTNRMLVGFVLIFVGMLVSELCGKPEQVAGTEPPAELPEQERSR